MHYLTTLILCLTVADLPALVLVQFFRRLKRIEVNRRDAGRARRGPDP